MASNKKELILQTAIELFYLKGYNAASTAEIAATAGIAEGTIFRHFKTKKEILLSVLEYFVDSFSNKVVLKSLNDVIEANKGISVKELLRIIILDRLAFVDKNSDVFWILITEMKYHPDLKKRIMDNVGSKAVKMLESVFEYGVSCGEIKRADTAAMQTVFLGLVISIILQHKIFPEVISVSKTLEESVSDALDLLFYGVFDQ